MAVLKRNQIYYFRKQINNKIHLISLKTKSKREANKRAKLLENKLFYLDYAGEIMKDKLFDENIFKISTESKWTQISIPTKIENLPRIQNLIKEFEKEKSITVETEKSDKRISDYEQKYIDQKDVNPLEIKNIQATFSYYYQLVGNTRIDSFNLEDLRLFVKRLKQTPINFKKINKLNIKMKDALSHPFFADKPRLSDKSVYLRVQHMQNFFNYLRTLKETRHFFKHLIEKDIYDTYNPKRQIKSQKIKLAFDNEHIAKFKEIKNHTAVENWNLFLILHYTGCRINEIVQLKPNDIKTQKVEYEDGSTKEISYISINADNDKNIKNTNSIRRIPLHENIKDFVLNLYKNNSNPFPATAVRYSYRLNKAIKNYIIDDKSYTTHCLRHLVTTELQKNMEGRLASPYILGHAVTIKPQTDHYISDPELHFLNEGIQRLNFKTLP